MEQRDIGQQYDKLAEWWDERHSESKYGVAQVEVALDFAGRGGTALDVGCGAGGRFVPLLQDRGFEITGLDASQEMIRLALSLIHI